MLVQNIQVADFAIKKVCDFNHNPKPITIMCVSMVLILLVSLFRDQLYKFLEQDDYDFELKPKPPDEYDSLENLSMGAVQTTKANFEIGNKTTCFETTEQEPNITVFLLSLFHSFPLIMSLTLILLNLRHLLLLMDVDI